MTQSSHTVSSEMFRFWIDPGQFSSIWRKHKTEYFTLSVLIDNKDKSVPQSFPMEDVDRLTVNYPILSEEIQS